MKIKNLTLLLIATIFMLTSCDQIKKAYEETFATNEKKHEDLEKLFNQGDNNIEKALQDAKDLMKGEEKGTSKAVQTQYIFLNPIELDNAQNKLYAFLDTKEIKVYGSIYITDSRIYFSVVNPQKPTEVDRYEYKNGEWRKDEPERLSAGDLENLDKETYLFSSVKLSNIHLFALNTMQKANGMEGAEMPTSFYLYHFSHRKPYWSTSIRTARADYSVEGDMDGNITKFEMR